MKTIIFCVILIVGSAMTFPQTSFYAGNSKAGSYPQLLSRFGGSGGDDVNVGNRIGEDSSSTSGPSTNTNVSGNELHDPETVSMVATWPKEHQPFWYLNSQHIDNQRGQNVPLVSGQQTLQRPLPRSPFARNQ